MSCIILCILAGMAYADAQTSLPCSVRISGDMFPVLYAGQPRNNPDDTFYPADAFYYLMWFSASPTCMGLSVAPLQSYEGLDVEAHNMTIWRFFNQDWHRWDPFTSIRIEVDPVKTSRPQFHTNLTQVPRDLQTVHYYKSGEDEPALSIREDQILTSSQKRLMEKILTSENHSITSTWEWDFVPQSASHIHHRPCPLEMDMENVRRGDIIMDADENPCRVPDSYVDDDSWDVFGDAIRHRCSIIAKYSGCIFGKVVIDDSVLEPKCLFEELDKMKVDHSEFPEHDKCVNLKQVLKQKITGYKRVCGESAGGTITCKNIPIHRTETLRPDILMPRLNLTLTHEILQDSDGYDARNLDDTYYLWDPITIRHVPNLQWKNSRDNTIHFEVQRIFDLRLEHEIICTHNACNMPLAHPGISTSWWHVGNGDGLAIYNATDDLHIRQHDIWYNITAYNTDIALAQDNKTTHALVVRYDPLYTSYPYVLLSDDMRTSYENRAAVALHYFGSVGGGSDDIPLLHEDRRSKLNHFVYLGFGTDPWLVKIFNATLQWSEARNAGTIEAEPQTRPEIGTVYSSHDHVPCDIRANFTAMMIRAGYCRIYFDYDILDAVADRTGPRHENITLLNNLASDHFAGRDKTWIVHYQYRFAEPFFHTYLNIFSVKDSNASEPVGISLEIVPNMDNHTQTIRDYIREKSIHDTGDPGFGIITYNDTYPVSYSESGEDKLDVKLRRIASKFETYGSDNQDIAGSNITSLATLYLNNSANARLEVPMDVGLGTLSPLAVHITANNVTRHYGYNYVDFSRNITIYVNVARDNPLAVERHHGHAIITADYTFERITGLYLNGTRYDTTCTLSCTIMVPSDKFLYITAENAWGGVAHAISDGLPREQEIRVPGNNLVPLALIALFAIPAYWAYVCIRNRN